MTSRLDDGLTPPFDDSFTLTAVGDTMVTRRLFPEGSPVSKLVRDADAAVTHLEAPILEDGPPASNRNGLYLRSPPWALDELDEFGFDLFAAASNHSGDFLRAGMNATLDALDSRGLVHAGLGRSLESARKPAYLDAPAGRVGLVAASATLQPGIEAGPSMGHGTARPGVAPLRTRVLHSVSEESISNLRELSDDLGLEAVKTETGVEDDETFTFFDLEQSELLRFVPDDETRITRQLHPQDTKAFLRNVREASARSDFAIASLHVHAGRGNRFNDRTVPSFLESIAHDCVRVGADAVVCHGPHVLRGIEVFEGAPIFYSLGNFAMQYETIDDFPPEMYRKHGVETSASPAELVAAVERDADGFAPESKTKQSVLPVWTFDPQLRVRLYPLDLGTDAAPYRRGEPRLADESVAAAVLDDLQQLSEPYGTTIERDDGVGVVHAD